MDIKRGLKKCVDEMNIPEAENVMPEGVSSSGERDEKKAGHRSRRYVSYACAGIAVAAAAAVCVFVWQPWKEVSDYDLYVGNAMDDATPPDESLTADDESDSADGSELFDVAVTDESMTDEEISELEDIENEDKKDLDESASVEASVESNSDSEYNDGVIYDNGVEGSAITETGATSTGASTEGEADDATSDKATVVSEEAAWSYSSPVVFTDSSDRQLTLTCTGISDSEISFIVRNDSEDTLQYGHYRRLYVENDGVWEEVELREYEEFVIAFEDVLYSLEPGEEFTEEIDIEFLWGSLEPGHYKVSLEEFYFHWQDKFLVEYEFYYGCEAEDESEESPTGYSNDEMQEIYAYYNDALYYYENLSTTSTLPDDAVNAGTAIITNELPDSDLEVSCMPEGTEIYYSEAKDKIYLTTDGEEYWILNCME